VLAQQRVDKAVYETYNQFFTRDKQELISTQSGTNRFGSMREEGADSAALGGKGGTHGQLPLLGL
jgi:hypothetical protein